MKSNINDYNYRISGNDRQCCLYCKNFREKTKKCAYHNEKVSYFGICDALKEQKQEHEYMGRNQRPLHL